MTAHELSKLEDELIAKKKAAGIPLDRFTQGDLELAAAWTELNRRTVEVRK